MVRYLVEAVNIAMFLISLYCADRAAQLAGKRVWTLWKA